MRIERIVPFSTECQIHFVLKLFEQIFDRGISVNRLENRMLKIKYLCMGLSLIGSMAQGQTVTANTPARPSEKCQASEHKTATLSFKASFNQTTEPGKMNFLTPSAGMLQLVPTDLIGKPYVISVFEGGFNQGVDYDLQRHWGVIPSDMNVEFTFPEQMKPGPYDVSFIVYTDSVITDADKKMEFPPVPHAGELSAFTLSQDQVLEGDPSFSNGVIRVNLTGCGSSLSISNKADEDDLLNSFNDTILVVP